MDRFVSYLSDRTQTFCAGVLWSSIPVICSVPFHLIHGWCHVGLQQASSQPSSLHRRQAACVSVPVKNVSLARQLLQRYISDTSSWCVSCRHQLSATKTELMWFSTRQMLEKLTDSDLTLDTCTTVIRPANFCSRSPSSSWQWADDEDIFNIVSSWCNNCRFAEFARFAGLSDRMSLNSMLVSAFILSRLDYCNSLLPWSAIQPLQRAMNAAACVVVNLSVRDMHVKPA